MPAKSILVAAGTQPNTVLGREDPTNVFLDGRWFQAVDENGQHVQPERVAKPKAVSVLMSIRDDGRGISFFGDLHPSFAGNVVKAMASAKQGYPVVSRTLARRPPSDPKPADLLDKLKVELRASVQDVIRLTPTIVEVVVRRRWRRAPSSPASSTGSRTTRPSRRAPTARCWRWRDWR
jgi:hypothetical protein